MIPSNRDIPQEGTASIRGNLNQIHPGRLLYGFFKAHKTGIITFNDDSEDIILYMLGGNLIQYDQGLFRQETFARHLVHHGLITGTELELYTRRARQEKTGPLDLMFRNLLLDRDIVRRLAQGFYERNILGIFSWRRGHYQFFEKTTLEGYTGQPDPLRTLRWILDGIRQKYHSGMIEARLEHRLRTPLKAFAEPPVPLSDLLITEPERQLLQWIQENRTLEQIINESSLGTKDARAIIFGLLTLECIKFVATNKKKRHLERNDDEEKVPASLSRIFREAEASVDRIKKETALEEEFYRERSARLSVVKPLSDEELLAGETTEDDAATILKMRLHETLREMEDISNQPDTQKPKQENIPPSAAATMAPVKGNAPVIDMAALEAIDLDAEEPTSSSAQSYDSMDLNSLPSLDESSAAPEDILKDLGTPPPSESTAFSDLSEGSFEDPFAEAPPMADFSPEDPPEQIFQVGLALIEKEDWPAAQNALRAAIDRGHVTPAAKINFGWCMYNSNLDDPERFAHAAALIQEGINMDSRLSLGFLILGRMYFAEGDKSMAELYFVKALEIDHGCREAKELIKQIYRAK